MPRSPCATSDIGTGTYTIMAQVAADMLGLPLENISIKLGNSTLPQSPVEGGSWIAASVSQWDRDDRRCDPQGTAALWRAMPRFAACRRDTGRRVAGRRQDRKQARCGRAMSITDAMRHGNVDRIEREKATRSRRTGHSPQHPFSDLRRGQGGRGARRHPRHPRRQRGRGWAHPQSQDRAQPGHGRRGLGHRHGAARGNADRSSISVAS